MFAPSVNFHGPELARQIVQSIERFSWTHVNEKRIQAELETLLRRQNPAWMVAREVKLGPRDRIDLLVRSREQSVGLEVKVQGSPQKVLDQLKRYAKHEQLDALILVTTKASLVRLAEETLTEERSLPLAFVHLRAF